MLAIDPTSTGGLAWQEVANDLRTRLPDHRLPLLEPPFRLNLGSGRDPREDMLNLDHVNHPTVDIVHDLDLHPWPFPTDSVDHVLLDNVLEHLDQPYHALLELARILHPGATATLIVPHYLSPAAHRPNHKSTWSRTSLNEYDDMDHGGTKGLDAHPLYHVNACHILHKGPPHGLTLPLPIRGLRPHTITWHVERTHHPNP